MRIRLAARVRCSSLAKPLPMRPMSGSAKAASRTARVTKASPARLKTALTRRHSWRSSRACWTKTGTNAAVRDGADEQVVQVVGDGAGEHEGVGAGGRAEGEGDDLVADQAQAAAQDVAQGDDRRGSDNAAARALVIVTLTLVG